MSERISHQSDDDETPNEWDFSTSEQTQVEPDVTMPDSDEIAGDDTQSDYEDSIDGSNSIDDKEKEVSRPITTQEIFNRTMEAAPEGEDPATYIYSKDGFQAFMNQMDACEREGYSSVDTQNAFYEFAGDYMDHGGRIPDGMDDAIFGTDSYYSSIDALLNDHSEVTKRMQEQRLKDLPGEVQAKIDSVANQIAEHNNEPNRYPKSLFGFYDALNTYSKIAEQTGQLSMEPVSQSLHDKLVPEVLPHGTETQDPSENYHILAHLIQNYPDALTGFSSPAIDVANYAANFDQDDQLHRNITSRMMHYAYEKVDQPVLNTDGSYAAEFVDYTYRNASSYEYTDDSKYCAQARDAIREIIGDERSDILQTIYDTGEFNYNPQATLIADMITRSDDPATAKESFERIINDPTQSKHYAINTIMAMRALQHNPELETSKATEIADESVKACFSLLLATIPNNLDNGTLDQILDIGTVADNIPNFVNTYRHDNQEEFISSFKDRIQSGKRFTDEEIQNLQINTARISNITKIPGIDKDLANEIQKNLTSRGNFLTPYEHNQAQNYDANIDLIFRISENESYDSDTRAFIQGNLIRRNLFAKSFATPEATRNLQYAIEGTDKINAKNVRRMVLGFMLDDENFTDKYITPESISGIADIIQSIQNSNSLELRRITEPLTRQLLDSTGKSETSDGIAYDTASAERKLASIEEVFLQNNLPNLGKNLLVFNALHPMESFRKDFIDNKKDIVSPMLAKYSERHVSNAYAIILNDLIHNSINSNSRELRGWLENLQAGQSIMDRIAAGETDFDSLDAQNQATVRSFVNSLTAGHNQTRAGQLEVRQQEAMGGIKNEADIPEGANWLYIDMPINQDTIARINRAMGANDRLNASDRLVRQFGYLSGLTSVEHALRILDENRDRIDKRNRETAKHPFVIHPGDLIKNTNGKYLDEMLSDGTNCQEYLGSSANSDGTPLDSDYTMRLGTEDTDIANCEEIQKNPNGDYGRVWYITRNTPERFVTTRKGEGHPGGEVEENPNMLDRRLELFQTGVVSESHYGVRTGISSAEIDAIVIDTQYEYIDKTAFRIVKNGFYIPVYDLKGELIFTPDDYDKLRAKLSGNHEYRTGAYNKASAEDFATDAEYTAGIDIDTEANATEVQRKDDAIRAALATKLEGTDLQFRDHIDDDLTPGFIEVSNTGSTGRGTNVPGDGDFDYIFRVDQSIITDPGRFSTLSSQLLSAIIMDEKSEQRSGNRPEDIRTKHVHVDGMEDEVDIDITFVPRTDKIIYATEDSIRDYLSNFEGDERAQVVKNIIAAKKLFKAHECYKPRHAGGEDENGKPLAQGGLGGVGVENWILQNGGSLTAAARSFLEAAGVLGQPEAKPKPLREFMAEYPIWDLGANHMAEEKGGYPHDNFTVNNLDEEGYKKVVGALRELLGETV